jgi:hypothetical protein
VAPPPRGSRVLGTGRKRPRVVGLTADVFLIRRLRR